MSFKVRFNKINSSFREVFLIVGSILLAFGIESWWESKLEYDQNTEALRELRVSLVNDLEDLEGNLEFHRSGKRSLEFLIAHLKEERSYNDSLDFHFAMAISFTVFLSDQSIYEYLQQNGRSIIDNDSLRFKITKLYAEDYQLIHELQAITNNIFKIQLYPYYAENFKDYKLFQNATPVNYQKLISSNHYITLLEMFLSQRRISVPRYEIAVKKVKSIIYLLDQELKAR
ncbi:MAG: hypothetical protein ACQETL_15720 [Bacteroidota bacterium]